MASPEIVIRDCEAKDIREMAGKLREADKCEIESYGWSVNKGLWRSFKASVLCKAIFVQGELAAVFGVGGALLSEIGTVWLLTSPVCEKVSPLAFARVYQAEVLKMLRYFPLLENHVHAGYDKAVKLLENIGFNVGDPVEYGEKNALYRKFSMRKA